jgi:hypothetical protein
VTMERHTTIPHLVPSALAAAAADKAVEIQLAWYINDYKVLSVMNTTLLKPGEWLAVSAVDQLCAAKGWTVKVADNEVIGTLFGLGASAAEGATKL